MSLKAPSVTFTSVYTNQNCPSAQESAGAQMPPEEGLPFMSSRVVVESGEGSRFQFFRSFDSCKRTPGNHSNVELAI